MIELMIKFLIAFLLIAALGGAAYFAGVAHTTYYFMNDRPTISQRDCEANSIEQCELVIYWAPKE